MWLSQNGSTRDREVNSNNNYNCPLCYNRCRNNFLIKALWHNLNLYAIRFFISNKTFIKFIYCKNV